MRHGDRVSISFYSFRRKVAFEEGANFAKDNNLVFMEVSAKTGYQVEESFKRNADLLLDKIEKGIIDTKNECPGIKVGNDNNTKQPGNNKIDSKTLAQKKE